MPILQIIEAELAHVQHARLLATARGNWQKAANADIAETTLENLKKRMVEYEESVQKRYAAGVGGLTGQGGQS